MAAWQAAPVRVSAAPLPLVASAPAPVNAPAPGRAAESAATRAHPFAELLRQSRDEGAAPVAPHERTLPIPRDQEASTSSETSEPESMPTSPTKARPRAAMPAASTGAKLASAALPADEAAELVRGEKDTSASSDVDSPPSAAASGDARADGWLAQALAAEHALAPTTERADGGRSRAAADVGAEAAADANANVGRSRRDELGHTGGPARAAASAPTRTMHGSLRAPPRAASTPIRASTPTLAASSPKRPAQRDRAHRPGAEAHRRAGAGACRRHSEPTGAAPAAAPTELTLATPIDSADSGAAFGVQVSVLAKDGVQRGRAPSQPGRDRPGLDPDRARWQRGANRFRRRSGGDARRHRAQPARARCRPERRRPDADRRRCLAARGRPRAVGRRRRVAFAARRRALACGRWRRAGAAGHAPRRRRRRRSLRLSGGERRAVWARKAALIMLLRAGPRFP